MQNTTERCYKRINQLPNQTNNANGDVEIQAKLASLMLNTDEDDLLQPTISLAFKENLFVSKDSEPDDSFMDSLIAPNYDVSSSDESLIVDDTPNDS